MSISILGFLLIFLKLFQAASLPTTRSNFVIHESLLGRRSRSDSLSDRASSISSSTNSLSSLHTLNTAHIPEILAQFLLENPPPPFFDQKRLFDVTEQSCWFQYFCMSSIPLYFTFTVLEQLLILEAERQREREPISPFYSFTFHRPPKESKIVDSMFKGALMIYFKNIQESSSTFDIFSDLNLPNCYKKAKAKLF